ncbi:YhfX family PLP-dependent enzyme [Caproiciproducens sp.]|uniref:YhfX family PLP-dependent enzyme n=1 Tax=Caproiciproducens sp. TaxID=1954376 RepID=UPI0028983E46|nr:YhfX family PLP-dependent enzyme [Caproiciproducens sp.]
MFLNKTIERNSALVETAIRFHQRGTLLPDTYIVDLDALLSNAALMKNIAGKNDIHLYFMLKQLGRNPVIARELMNMGFDGVVAVDFREAMTMIDAGVKLGNVGHLVQLPKASLKAVLAAKPEVVTVFSLEKAREISEVCREMNLEQKLLLRILDDADFCYSGQCGGVSLEELPSAATEIGKLANVQIVGLTSFPCFTYQKSTERIEPTSNVGTLQKAEKLLKGIGVEIEQMNMPSATCCASIPLIRQLGGTHGEPGHGLIGTTPLHEAVNCPEIPAMVYLTEVSHNFKGRAYCYGGGHYRRSHVENALVGSLEQGRVLHVTPPTEESIDYYFELGESAQVSESVVMAFRTQIFVTRSQVALVKGVSKGSPEIVGVYTALGKRLL